MIPASHETVRPPKDSSLPSYAHLLQLYHNDEKVESI
jgi:hypothetical protein